MQKRNVTYITITVVVLTSVSSLLYADVSFLPDRVVIRHALTGILSCLSFPTFSGEYSDPLIVSPPPNDDVYPLASRHAGTVLYVYSKYLCLLVLSTRGGHQDS
jgi:hypothetical protein